MQISIPDKCSITDCIGIGRLSSKGRPRTFSLGYCGAHYDKWYTYGDPLFVKKSYNDNLGKILTKIIFPEDYVDGCWDWSDYKNELGYGQFRMISEDYVSAHRASYIIFVSENIEGLDIDHLCRNPSCTNPNHLEAVTSKENTLRGFGASALNHRKTVCLNGHSLSGHNLANNKWGRVCITCRRNRCNHYHRNMKKNKRCVVYKDSKIIYRTKRYETLEEAQADKEKFIAHGEL
tara:strand:+ start:96 stop:797 length:702 start_codon:yes stop_codon:yes gene_type:complete